MSEDEIAELDGITDAMNINLGRLREMVRDGGGLACCSPWGRKESGVTGRLNNKNRSDSHKELKWQSFQ